MTPARTFSVAAALGRATALLVFGLIVLGSVVRSTNSGLACPDWPLCEGRVIPRLEPHVLIEWSHRTVALLVSLMLFTTAGWVLSHRATRQRLGRIMGLALALLLVQVLLGALTVWKLLSPAMVSSHLAVALLLFVTLLTLTMIAQTHADEDVAAAPAAPGLATGFGAVTVLTYLQAVLGGVVSSNHAGLVCPDWPTCDGMLFPPLRGLIGLQMAHRYGAYLLVIAVLVVALKARTAADPAARAGAGWAVALVGCQVALGVSNVLLQTPPWLTAMHLATAALLLAVLVITTFRLASAPAPERTWIPAQAR